MTDMKERLMVLKMIEDGKVSADDGAKLLGSLGEKGTATVTTESVHAGERAHVKPPVNGKKWFRVRVSDIATGRTKTTVNLPMGLVDWGLKVGAMYAPELNDLNIGELQSMLTAETEGLLVDVYDEEDGERVEIFVE